MEGRNIADWRSEQRSTPSPAVVDKDRAILYDGQHVNASLDRDRACGRLSLPSGERQVPVAVSEH